jgi:hypothetical protein
MFEIYLLQNWPLRNVPTAAQRANITAFHRYLKAQSDYCKRKLFAVYLDARKRGRVKKRNYKIEYILFNDTQRSRSRLRKRQRNRQQFAREGLVRKGDGTEIHHIDGNPQNNRRNNLAVVSGCAHKRLHGQVCRKRRNARRSAAPS